MESGYVEGYTTEAEFCPFCGSSISTTHADGSNDCDDCGRRFSIVEDNQHEDA